jgi:carboxypeptidase family protein
MDTKFFERSAFLKTSMGLVLYAVLLIAAQAQSYTGSITGIVTDQNGALVPNANVTMTSVDTGLTRSGTSNSEGVYLFTSLPPGAYTLRISAGGFSTRDIRTQLTVSQQLRLDAQLKVGGAAESMDIVVSEGGVAVESQNAQLSNVITERQIKDLPLITRNAYDLVGLSAGATDGPDKGTGFMRGNGVAINGQRSQSGNFILDGGENNDTFVTGPGQTVPLDAIQEFRVQTNNYTAEYGRGSGFVANVVTKSGTNNFHGTAYEFNRNAKLAANDFFNNANNFDKAFFNRNQFGFSGGGPVIKNKTFFFGSAEWLKVRSSVDTGFFVPTPQLLAASSSSTASIFSQSPPPAITGRLLTAADLGVTGLTSASGAPIDPSTPLFGQVTIPLPRDAGAELPQNTFLWTGRVDHTISDRTSLFGRYAYERSNFLDGTNSFSPYAGYTTDVRDRNQNFTLQLTHTWSPRVVTESRLIYNRLREDQPLGAAPVSPTFFINDVIASQTDGDVVLPGYFATASTIAAAIPFGGPQNLYQGYSTLSWQLKDHTLKFGGQYIHIRDNRSFGAFQNAVADFGNLQSFINGTIQDYTIAVDPGGKFPGEVLNAPFTAPSFTRHFHYNEVAWFAEDTYKIRPRLTLNAGLRWEYFGVLHSPGSERTLDANFYFGDGSNQLEQIANGRFDLTANQTGDLKNRFYKPDYNNFAPRIGVAYDLFGDSKTILRAGYGLFYDRNYGNVLFNVIQNPPNYAVLVAGALNGTPITANVDQYAALGSVSGQSYASSARALDQNLKTAYANVWNVNVQHELKNNYVVTLAYAGSNGISLYSITDVNRIGSGVLLGRPGERLNPNIGGINLRSNAGHSNYNSFQASIDSRYIKWAGLQFRAAYTWSHAIDNESSTFGDSYLLSRVGGGVLGFQDSFNPAGDKGDADFDVRHRFVTSFVWDIPFAKNLKNGILNKALNGWAMNGVVSFRTGVPFTVFDTGQADNNGASQPIRPTVTGPVSGTLSPLSPTAGAGGTFDYLDFSGLSPTPSVNGPFVGTLGRNTFRAPGLQTWNVSFFRNINITESKKLQFRAEFFNLFNHPNLFVAGGSNDIAGGTEAVQVTRGGLFDNISNAEQHRNVQLGLKFIF